MLIILAHTQKPPDETRILDKIAASLAHIDGANIVVAGCKRFVSDSEPTTSAIKLVHCFSGNSGWRPRLENLLVYWRMLIRRRPEVLIVCSADLLPIAILYKCFFGSCLIWDVQENNARNLTYQKVYRERIRLFASVYQYFTFQLMPFIDQFWLAEQIYKNQMHIPDCRSVVLENKVSDLWKTMAENSAGAVHAGPPYFLFSGVATSEAGIEAAMIFFENWVRLFPHWQLRVVGLVPDVKLRVWLKAKAVSNVEFFGFDKWVPSKVILEHLQGACAVLMPYIETEANRGKKPTKLFEARFCGKPVLVWKNGWLHGEPEAIGVDFLISDPFHFLNIMEKIKAHKAMPGYDFFEGEELCRSFRSVVKPFLKKA